MTNKPGVPYIDVSHEMRQSFLEYSMSVIIDRALPDIRDGLKPVHRRVLYTMWDSNNTHDRAYMKSARTVGSCLGKFHPHGDLAVYETMARMAQGFTLNQPCVEGQGNWGSQDGDPIAAARYTEARLSKYGECLLADIQEETVEMTPNYDGSLLEPTVLPSRAPNLLINGSQGIAVGMATNIPPHNLKEVCSAALELIDNPAMTIPELMEHVPAPDFPTGAELIGMDGVKAAYTTGKGRCMMRSKSHFEDIKGGRKAIIFTEVPYQVTMSSIVEAIADLVNEKKIESISDVRDESNKEGVRIVVELKRNEVPEVVLNQLYQMTRLQTSFPMNMVVICHGVPKLTNLKEMIQEWVWHRYEVVTQRSLCRLKKAEAQMNLCRGLRKALDSIDLTVHIIRSAKDPQEAKQNLISQLGLNEVQAQAILETKLRKLTSMESTELDSEIESLTLSIAALQKIIDEYPELVRVVKEEIQEVIQKFGTPRRSQICEATSATLTKKDLIADEQVIVTMTQTGYIKRTDVDSYRKQRRGGKGKIGAGMKEEDEIKFIVPVMTHDCLMIFTNQGRAYTMEALDVPEGTNTGKGKHLKNLLDLQEGEEVVTLIPVRDALTGWLTFVTSQGLVKKTDIAQYLNIRSKGIAAIKIDSEDCLVRVLYSDKDYPLFLQTKKGMCIQFHTETIRPTGRTAMGVVGMKFKQKGDRVIDADLITMDEPQILLVTEKGYGKRVEHDNFRVQNRGGMGLVDYKTDKSGDVIALLQIHQGDELVAFSKAGQSLRCDTEAIRETGRAARGTKVMDLADDDMLVSIGILRDL